MARGDHLRVRRLKGAYHHHGIDLGDGRVVHFSGEPLRWRDARVVCDALDDFCRGVQPEIVPHEGDTREVEETIATALAHVGEAGYQLWTNNCEHFARYCKTGRRESVQVRRFVRSTALTGATVMLVGVAVIARGIRQRSLQNRA